MIVVGTNTVEMDTDWLGFPVELTAGKDASIEGSNLLTIVIVVGVPWIVVGTKIVETDGDEFSVEFLDSTEAASEG